VSELITAAFVQQYKGNIHIAYQQAASKLREAVNIEPQQGEFAYVDILSATTAQPYSGRASDTTYVDSIHTRRQRALQDYVWSDLIDMSDRVRTLIQPDSAYVTNCAMAFGRRTDETIFTAFNASVKEGKTGSTTTAFDTSNYQIAHGSAGLTLAKIISASKTLNLGDVPMDDRYFAIDPAGLEDLLADSTITSADYNTLRMLQSGTFQGVFMGFKWIVSTLVPKSGSTYSGFAWHKRSMSLGIGKDLNVKVTELPTKNFNTQVWASMMLGAVRVEDAGVVEVQYQ